MSDFDLTQPALPNLIRLVLKFNMAASIKNNLMKGNTYDSELSYRFGGHHLESRIVIVG